MDRSERGVVGGPEALDPRSELVLGQAAQNLLKPKPWGGSVVCALMKSFSWDCLPVGALEMSFFFFLFFSCSQSGAYGCSVSIAGNAGSCASSLAALPHTPVAACVTCITPLCFGA